MTEQNQENSHNSQSQSTSKSPGRELDVASKYLSNALKTSFSALKVIMIILVILFLISGFETVGPGEEAIVLRFGKIQGTGEDRILKSGLHWVFPYPIDKIVKIPVKKKINLLIDSFWYYERPSELLPQGPKARQRIPKTLDPIREGYCITRSQKESQADRFSVGSDYNIVHSKWQLTYHIDNPERFFKNVYTDDVEPGESYARVMEKSITPLLEYLVDDAVVTAMVYYTIDEAIASYSKIPDHVERLLQEKLDLIESGIKVESIQLTHTAPPRQVSGAFQAYFTEKQKSQTAISEGKGYAQNTLNEAAGPVAYELLEVLDGKQISKEQEEQLWAQLAGAAQQIIVYARAYRTRVVEKAKANAKYLQSILPEYRKRPKLVIENIYMDAIEYILSHADEKIIIQPTEGASEREIRILLSRDPSIKPKSEEEK